MSAVAAIFQNGRQNFHPNLKNAVNSLFFNIFGHAVHEFNVF